MATDCARALLRLAAMLCVLLLLPAAGQGAAMPSEAFASAVLDLRSITDSIGVEADHEASEPHVALDDGQEPCLPAAVLSALRARSVPTIRPSPDDRPGASLRLAPEVPPSRSARMPRTGS